MVSKYRKQLEEKVFRHGCGTTASVEEYAARVQAVYADLSLDHSLCKKVIEKKL
jgi:hypothetical protein